MSMLGLSFRNIISRPLTSILSLLLLSLGVGLISLVIHLREHFEEQITKNFEGIDMVVGAKGSPLQLIFSAVLQADVPTGNIPFEEAMILKKNPLVKTAIPLSYGDSYQGFRIVGTSNEYLTQFDYSILEGRTWEKDFEVVIGGRVASDLGLKIGDEFLSQHGFNSEAEEHGDHPYKVVGLLKPSGKVADKLILTGLESIWHIHSHEEHQTDGVVSHHGEGEEEHHHEEGEEGHHHEEGEEGHHHEEGEEKHHHEKHEHGKEITALLLEFRNPMGIISMPRKVNSSTSMQSAVPSFEINRLFSLLGVGIETLHAIAITILLVSGLSVFISLFNTLKDRVFELALMRTYGASRWALFELLILEGLILSLLGSLVGLVISRLGLVLVNSSLSNQFGFSGTSGELLMEELAIICFSLFIGVLAALIPGLKALNLNITKTLRED